MKDSCKYLAVLIDGRELSLFICGGFKVIDFNREHFAVL